MAADTIETAVGRDFVVRLPSTPTTGYVWEASALPPGVELVDSGHEPPASPASPGDAAMQFFRFRARQAGEHVIRFGLKRRWESTERDSHTVTVKVR